MSTAKPFHFELTDETICHDRTTFFRIRATCDFEVGYDTCVKKGDLGGWVTTAYLPDGRPRISSDSWLGGNALVADEAILTDGALVTDNARLDGKVKVIGATICDTIHLTGTGSGLVISPEYLNGSLRLVAEGRIHSFVWSHGSVRYTPEPVNIDHQQALVTLENVGPYGNIVTIVKLKSGKPFIYQEGNGWWGTYQEMRDQAAEIVSLCGDRFVDPGEETTTWVTQYRLIADLAANLETLWRIRDERD